MDPARRWVFKLEDGSAEMRELLGNKGANLAEMVHLLGADVVPGGFTVSTEACVAYMLAGAPPSELDEEVGEALGALERSSGLRFGDPDDPLLVAVRSGAPVSMPGMLDTVLNLGLNPAAVEGLARRSGNPRFAWDSRRRLVQMFAEVVCGVPAEGFEEALAASRDEHGAAFDHELDESALRALVERFLAIHAEQTGEDFPEDPREQLRRAILAVFDSWNNERAVTYRRLNRIPTEIGTAVTVQRMVFGNLGERSGAGVAFTRDPTTGEPGADGDFLLDAQGEDVVAGVRNTETLDGLERRMPDLHAELLSALDVLERHYCDIQDVEYTIEDGRLYILQTRNAKRHARAAVRFAVDGHREGMLTREEGLLKVDPGSLSALMHPAFDPEAKFRELTRGVAASPGAAKGRIVFSAREAEERAAAGEDVILLRPFTSADDVGGFHAARGILTSQGGKSSHAAIVARGMGRPCVCGASEVLIDAEAGRARIGETVLRAGDPIAIDGSTGVVTADDVALVEPQLDAAFSEVLGWATSSGASASAPTPTPLRTRGGRASSARRESASAGPSTCSSAPIARRWSGRCSSPASWRGANAGRRTRTTGATRPASGQRSGGSGRSSAATSRRCLRAMEGLRVTIRLLDPPLHEFIGPAVFERELSAAEAAGEEHAARAARSALEVARELEEVNPMLGTRGARLGLHLRRHLRDAGAGDRGGGTRGGAGRWSAERRGDDPAGRLSGGAEDSARRGRGSDRGDPRGAEARGRDDDRAAGGLPGGRRDRGRGRVLQLRHQRPDPDGAGALPRRRRAWVLAGLPRARDHRDQPVRDHRRTRGRRTRRDRDRARSRCEAVAEARRLR